MLLCYADFSAAHAEKHGFSLLRKEERYRTAYLKHDATGSLWEIQWLKLDEPACILHDGGWGGDTRRSAIAALRDLGRSLKDPKILRDFAFLWKAE